MTRQRASSPKPMHGRRGPKWTVACVALAAFAATLAACSGNEARATRKDRVVRDELVAARKQADVAAVYQLQADFHRAATTKDLDLMMSLWAEDATLLVGGKTYTGKEQLRTFVATQLGAFKPENRWVALTHSPKIKIAIQGDEGTLDFVCHYADAATKEIESMASAKTKAVRDGDRWLFKEFIAGPSSLSE